MSLYGIGPAPVETGLCGMAEFAKAHDNAGLPLLHDEEATHQPKKQDNENDDAGADAHAFSITGQTTAIGAATLIAFASQEAIQALIEITPELIEIRRAIFRTLAILARFLIRLVLRSAAPARVVQRKLQAEFLDDRLEHAVAFRGKVFLFKACQTTATQWGCTDSS